MARTNLDERIARLEADLKTAKATKTKEGRTERNNQLMAFGIMLETKYKELPALERAKIKSWMGIVDGRNKERCGAGFDRLDSGLTRKEISSEPPSQGSDIAENK